ncbi:hypothetical protein SteCoe_34896 [Stentor coeruleus]|uniref:Uncharacterized protein n=1 Tax=Stentor coeruleus TaxID=5963 RepID=A0A1R2ATQ9_9CILI|nr:hypothetical protein SteCoe_34896 [Stentor coeruleus]
MIVPKVKNSTHSVKIEALQENSHKVGKIITEDMRLSLSKANAPSQIKIQLKKARSTSVLKQKLSQIQSINVTPLNKKSHNKSFVFSDALEIINLSQTSKSSKKRFLQSIEIWLSEQIKAEKASPRYFLYLEGLQKLTSYDPNLKKLISTISSGLENCLKMTASFNQISPQHDMETEKYRSQINELRNSIKGLAQEKKNYKKNIGQFNSILAYMKKQGVPVEQCIQEFYEFTNKKEKKNSLSSSVKVLPNFGDSRIKECTVPKLTIVQPSGIGFHQEFMAKAEEFSESWRQLLKNEKSG